MATAVATKGKKIFAEYPAGADKFFQQNAIYINGLPISIRQDIETKNMSTHITSASQYASYIQAEIAFWEERDPNKKLVDYSQVNKLRSALSEFQSAVNLYATQSTASGNADNHMRQSVKCLSSGHLCSKTRLARFLLKNISKSKSFWLGFMCCLSQNRTQSLPSASIDALEGFIVALEYSKSIKALVSMTDEDVLAIIESAKQAADNYSRLNSDYTVAFHSQEDRLKELSLRIDNEFQRLSAESETYYKEKESRCQELEKLYEEKLKLQAPAEYWDEMAKKCSTKGYIWLGVSIGTTLLIIALLIAVLAYMPNLFSEESHWFEILKNSAIITVVTSIAVYMLRFFVKMSTSSFHLSSDARERSKLTYFYLALIEKKAVTEKERAIILNSLFSRSDTGMLRGDSSPTMSGNISELVQTLNNH